MEVEHSSFCEFTIGNPCDLPELCYQDELVISFSGHRPDKLGSYSIPNPIATKVYDETKRLLLDLKPVRCITGVALGFDTYAAWACLELGIPYIAAVPFKGQELAWPKGSQDIYRHLLAKASEVKIVCEGGYAAYKMQVRNQWMIDNSQVLIACFDGSPGGTANCVEYARKVNRKTYIINPRTL